MQLSTISYAKTEVSNTILNIQAVTGLQYVAFRVILLSGALF